jgi:hypothetical protein
VKEKWGRFGRVAVESTELLTRVRVARWKAWPAVEKCLLKYSIVVDLSVVSVPYLQCSGQLGGGALILHGLYSVPELF